MLTHDPTILTRSSHQSANGYAIGVGPESGLPVIPERKGLTAYRHVKRITRSINIPKQSKIFFFAHGMPALTASNVHFQQTGNLLIQGKISKFNQLKSSEPRLIVFVTEFRS